MTAGSATRWWQRIGDRAHARPADRESRVNWIAVAVVVTLGVVAAIQAVWVIDRAIDHPGGGMMGFDFELYMGATHRWLAGGSFYLPEQLAGPYDMPWGQILYPPVALGLFAPFTVLGGPLFVLIPTAITLGVIAYWRPRLWAWGVIFGLLIAFPLTPLPWISGTPTIWMVAFVALSTRWPWMSAFVWFKPSVFPFALIGIRDRRWWAVTGLFAVGTVLLWPPTLQWITAVLNARGENSGLLYSLGAGALAAPLIPVVAWAGRSQRKRPRPTSHVGQQSGDRLSRLGRPEMDLERVTPAVPASPEAVH